MTKAKKKDEKAKVIPAEKERLIYCGPNIGFKVSKDTTYIGGIPKGIDEEIKECKEILNLFVPMKKYVETKKNIEEEGTIENLSYKAVQAFTRNEKRGEINEL